MKTRTSQAVRRTAAASAIKKQVIQLLGIDEMDYCIIQFETGICYLSLLLQDEYYESAVRRNRLFWTWWKNQWLLRDEQFLKAAFYSNIVVNQNGKFCKNMDYKGDGIYYLQLNNPAVLASEVHPNSIVLKDSYAGMIAQIIEK